MRGELKKRLGKSTILNLCKYAKISLKVNLIIKNLFLFLCVYLVEIILWSNESLRIDKGGARSSDNHQSEIRSTDNNQSEIRSTDNNQSEIRFTDNNQLEIK